MPRLTWNMQRKKYLVDYMNRWVPGMPYPPEVDWASANAVELQITKMGIGMLSRNDKEWTDEDVSRLVSFMANGYSIDDASKMLRRTAKSVREKLRMIEAPDHGDRTLYAGYAKDGTIVCVGTRKDIAEYYGISEKEVEKIGKSREQSKRLNIYYCGEDVV